MTLIAVGKTFPAEAIEQAIAAGQRVFGENRVQETKAKWPALRARHAGLSLHLIGPLQSNKAKEAVALFDAIHSVDRREPVRSAGVEGDRQSRAARRSCSSRSIPAPSRRRPASCPKTPMHFCAPARKIMVFRSAGLMCIPPFDEAPAPHFALTAKIAARNGLKLLSMGMSADYRIAIAFGATHVRVGSAIFGHREQIISSATRSER